MKAVVPAAGAGTRLRPLTEAKPKGLVEISNRPLLSYVFDRLVDLAVEEIVVVIGYRGELIRDNYGNAYRGTPITYVTQDRRLGLADAVVRAAGHIESTFVILNGDNVFSGDLIDVLNDCEHDHVSGTVVVERSSIENARATGVIVTDDENRVKRIVEKPDKPPTTLITTGCYVLPPALFETRDRLKPSDQGEFELADAINELIAAGHRFRAVPYDGWRVNVNTAADVDRAERFIDSQNTSFE